MGTRTAQEVVDRVVKVLNDLTSVTWSAPELLGWINDGQRAIVTKLPQAYPVRITLPVTPSDALQNLPDDAFRLIKIMRNLGVDGATQGRPILPISETQLYNIDVNWTVSSLDTQVKHYCYDPTTPYLFWIYPRVNLPVYVEAWVSKMPDDLGSMSSTLLIDDSFFNPLIDYVLFRCYQKNSDVQGSAEMVAAYWSVFNTQLESRDAGDRGSIANTAPTRVGQSTLR